MTHEQVANMFKFERDLILSKFNQLDMLPIVGYFVDGEPTSHNSKLFLMELYCQIQQDLRI